MTYAFAIQPGQSFCAKALRTPCLLYPPSLPLSQDIGPQEAVGSRGSVSHDRRRDSFGEGAKTPSRQVKVVNDEMVKMNLPEPGQLVAVRQRHFVVLDVQKFTLPADSIQTGIGTAQHVVSVSPVEDDAWL